MQGIDRALHGLACLLLLAAPPAAASALEPGGAPSARDVAQRVAARSDGQTLSQVLEMELREPGGAVRRRRTRLFRKYVDGQKRTVIFFESPANVRRTAFLTWDHADPGHDDDQWLYLPALRKVRRISSSDRGRAFMGTDFTYEDMKNGSKVNVDDYAFALLGEEARGGRRLLRLEATPRSSSLAEELGYGRILYHVDPASWMVRAAEMWDVQDNPLKTVEMRDVRRVQGVWTAHEIEARNHKTGHESVFRVRDVRYDEPMADALFDLASLRRGPAR